ncbi:4Fe-4S dicluster domain-containing protein [Candidatus Thorarchaeota archaeon]|nr:MAG: 4Fe-4S dicluster domain-containing protein [Candidatus Thorarchaeota archaeon]
MADIRVELAGLRFRNPILTAAGPKSKDGMTLLSAAAGGAGGLVAKTVSIRPAEVPRPNMSALGSGRVASQRGLLNAELWSEIPLERWLEREYAIALSSGLPLIASVGYTPEEVAELAPRIVDTGVHAIEFSTHYVGGHRKIARALREAADVPIFAKLSPKVDVSDVAKEIEPFVDGFVAINTYGPCLRIDIETGKPTLGSDNGYGWMSGAALRPIALRCVADIAKSVNKPVIGVGGVGSGEDAIEFFMAGAQMVQICTAAILKGDTVYGQVAKEVKDWLDTHGHNSLEDIRGIALPCLRDNKPQKPPAEVDLERCTLCGLCPKSCVYDAITLDRENEVLIIDAEKCAGCGLCVTVCPQHALSLKS